MRERVGPYRLLRQLGGGGMGVVFEALHEKLERHVAIKFLHAELTGNPQVTARFLNEARAVNIVRHPSLVDIHELGQLDDGTLYIVMEYLDGTTLGRRIQVGEAITYDELLRLARQVASALTIAHGKGIVHRDLKPDNIMIVIDPEVSGGTRVKLLDFGIAKMLGQAGNTPAGQLTHSGLILGTPQYMSPEQCMGGGNVDGKADVYALGVILYELVSGALPFSASGWELLAQHLNLPPAPLPAQVPPPIADLIARMLQKDRVARPTMSQVASELASLRSDGQFTLPPAQRPTIRIAPRRTTLGASAGERTPVPPPTRRARGVAWALAGGLVVGGAITAALLTMRPAAPVAVPVVIAAPAPSPAAPLRPEPPEPPEIVRWTLTSVPDNAILERVDNGEPIGRTPWHSEQTAHPGSLNVRVRLAGYQPRELVLSQDHDERHQVRLRRGHTTATAEREQDDVQTVH